MMKSFILSLTVFCAISGTGLSIDCFECSAKNSETCEGVSVSCPNSDECVVMSEFYRSWDTKCPSVKKGCNPGVPCNSFIYTSNFVEKDLIVYVSCCTKDNCNTGGYEMPPLPEERKGRICPSCYGDGREECVSDRTATCINEEDECLTYIGKLRDPAGNIVNRTFTGCASPLACELKFAASIGVEPIETDVIECTKE